MNNSIVITGASGSMGSEAVKAVCREGYPVIMACRNLKKGENVRQGILKEYPTARITLLQMDLSSFDSIRYFAEELKDERIAGLFNNAGVINRDFSLSPDGLERTMAVNYIGPYLLTRLLLDNMDAGASIVNMVSLTTRFASLDKTCLIPDEKKFHQLRTYAQSKLALQTFTVELGRRLYDGRLGEELRHKSIRVNMADPGIVDSNMISMGRWFDPVADKVFRPFCKRASKGVMPAVRALFSDESGRYFVGGGSLRAPSLNPLSSWLWEETEKAVRL